MSDRQLDVLFVTANGARSTYQGLAKDYAAVEIPTWSLLLAQSCRSAGFGVAILDCWAENLDLIDSVTRIVEADPRLVVIVAYGSEPNQSTVRMGDALRLADELKAVDPFRKTCFVGNHVSALPLDVLGKSSVDFVLLNEGIYALRNLLKTDLYWHNHTIKGIGWKSDEGSPYLNTPERIVPQERMDLDLSGYAFDLIDFSKYRSHFWHGEFKHELRTPSAALYSSLGCPMKCGFCMINIVNRTDNSPNVTAADSPVFRYWSADHTLKQIEWLVNHGITMIRLSDEMFFLNRKHYEPILQGIKERWGDSLRLWSYARIDTVRPQFLKLFREAGVRWLCLGIESANRSVRREVSKGSFEDVDIKTVVKEVEDAGIDVIANYIFGLTGDTHETMQQTLDLSIELNTAMWNAYCCFKAGTLVHTPSGCTPIEDVRVGDVVLSQNGTTRVTRLMRRDYCGAVYKVKARYAPPVVVTGEHPILVVEIKRGTDRKTNNLAVIGSCSFVETKNLRPFNRDGLRGMYHAVVVTKKSLEGGDTYVDFSPFVKGQVGVRADGKTGGQLTPFGRRYLEKWPVTEAMAELFGWYVAEGSLGSKQYPRVVFSLGSHEMERAQHICKLIDIVFGLKAKIKQQRGSVLRVSLQSKVLHRAVHSIFGEDCYTKRIPVCIMEAKPDIMRAFIKGYQTGDGITVPSKNNQLHVSTASRLLGNQLFRALLKIGIVAGYMEVEPADNLRACDPTRLVDRRSRNYRLTWSVGSGKRDYLEDDNNYYFPIKSIDTEEFGGVVYNIETVDHTYCVPYVVHNCTALPGSPLYHEAKQKGIKLPDTYSGYGFLSYDCQPLPTETLSAADVLRFRDEAFVKYWERPAFHEMIRRRFGDAAVDNIKDMLKVKLRRKLLGDTPPEGV